MATDETRKAVSGWKSIMANRQGGQKSAPQQKVQPKQEIITEQEAPNAEFDFKRARQHMQKLNEEKQNQLVFKGNAQQIALKLNLLTEGDADMQVKGGKKVKVISCEEAGVGLYKLTYILLND